MRLLITGASGFLGRRAAAHFTQLGWTVLTPGHAQLDITNESAVRHWFIRYRPRLVLHCAAVSDTGACRREPERTARINVQGAEMIAAACRMLAAKLVLCSSDQVYAGSVLPGPHREDELLIPGNEYARQKLEAERRCARLCETVSLRLSWMYTTAPQPGEHGHFLTTLEAALRDESLPLRWPVHDRRGITDVDAVVAALPAALELPVGVYNFGAPNDADTFSTVQAVLRQPRVADALAAAGLQCAASRLTPDTAAFADTPRDIRMDMTRTTAAGIAFAPTQQGLCDALEKIL